MKKKLLILGLIMVMALTGCGKSEEKKETEKAEVTDSGESGTGYEYFKPIIEDINNDKDSAVTAKFKSSTLTFQLILKDGKEIKNVEGAKESAIEFSKGVMEATGDKGYKVEYVDKRNTKKPLLQAEDGKITINTFETVELTEENVRKLAEEIFNKTVRETDSGYKGFNVRSVSIKNGEASIIFKEDKFLTIVEKKTLDLYATHIVDFVQMIFKDEDVKNININIKYDIKDQKGNKEEQDILVFETSKDKVSGVDWIGFRKIVSENHQKLGEIANVYKIDTSQIK